jgi:hypothetical protein
MANDVGKPFVTRMLENDRRSRISGVSDPCNQAMQSSQLNPAHAINKNYAAQA